MKRDLFRALWLVILLFILGTAGYVAYQGKGYRSTVEKLAEEPLDLNPNYLTMQAEPDFSDKDSDLPYQALAASCVRSDRISDGILSDTGKKTDIILTDTWRLYKKDGTRLLGGLVMPVVAEENSGMELDQLVSEHKLLGYVSIEETMTIPQRQKMQDLLKIYSTIDIRLEHVKKKGERFYPGVFTVLQNGNVVATYVTSTSLIPADAEAIEGNYWITGASRYTWYDEQIQKDYEALDLWYAANLTSLFQNKEEYQVVNLGYHNYVGTENDIWTGSRRYTFITVGDYALVAQTAYRANQSLTDVAKISALKVFGIAVIVYIFIALLLGVARGRH